MISAFLSSFEVSTFASWASFSRSGVELSSQSAYRPCFFWSSQGWTRSGFPCFARSSFRSGRVPSIPRGRRCSHDPPKRKGRRLPFLYGQPLCILIPHPVSGSRANEAFEDSLSFTRPTFSSPVAPDGNGTALGLSFGLRTRPLPAAHAEGGDRP